MPIARGTVWPNRGSVTAADLNAEFDIIHNKINGNMEGADFTVPFTMPGTLDMDNYPIVNASQIFGRRVVYPGTKIQDVVDELASSITSGEVMLAPGTHNSDDTTISLPIGISLFGPGSEACSIESPFAGPVITIGDGTFDARYQKIGGFKINGQANNTGFIKINPKSNQSRAFIDLFGMDMDGGTPGATLAQAIEIAGAMQGIRVSDCDIYDCTNVGILADQAGATLEVISNRFDTNDIDIKLVTVSVPTIRNNTFTGNGSANVSLDRTICPNLLYNDFNSNYTHEVLFVSNGSTDASNNFGGISQGNVHRGTSTNCIGIAGVRGHTWESNTFTSSETRVFETLVGTQSNNLAWKRNLNQVLLFNADPSSVFTYIEDTYNETLPIDHATEPGFDGIRIARYTASPSTATWGAQEYGRMWIVDSGDGVTVRLEYFDREGSVHGVALT